MDIKLKQSLCSKRRNRLLKKITQHEIEFSSILKALNVRFIPQKGFISGKNFCIVDFYLPDYKICVEIDGEYHNRPSQIERDRNKDYYLSKQRKFSVLHIKNESLKSLNNNDLFQLLKDLKQKKRVVYL